MCLVEEPSAWTRYVPWRVDNLGAVFTLYLPKKPGATGVKASTRSFLPSAFASASEIVSVTLGQQCPPPAS